MSLNRKKQISEEAAKGGLCYISAIVLGLNDALVELTGALAGFTMAFRDNQTIALAGITTGVAATLSMAASEFLSQEASPETISPYTAATVTGMAYMLTVFILLLPFILLDNPFKALGCCMASGALLITAFTFVTSRIRKVSFIKSCLQMLCISFGVMLISFGIGWLAKTLWGIRV